MGPALGRREGRYIAMEEFTALIAWAAQALAAWRQANPILAEGVSFA